MIQITFESSFFTTETFFSKLHICYFCRAFIIPVNAYIMSFTVHAFPSSSNKIDILILMGCELLDWLTSLSTHNYYLPMIHLCRNMTRIKQQEYFTPTILCFTYCTNKYWTPRSNEIIKVEAIIISPGYPHWDLNNERYFYFHNICKRIGRW